jgi:hypothetical protein
MEGARGVLRNASRGDFELELNRIRLIRSIAAAPHANIGVNLRKSADKPVSVSAVFGISGVSCSVVL